MFVRSLCTYARQRTLRPQRETGATREGFPRELAAKCLSFSKEAELLSIESLGTAKTDHRTSFKYLASTSSGKPMLRIRSGYRGWVRMTS